jgi:virginiamycin A acetyltransferase
LAPHVAIVGDDHLVALPGVPKHFAGRPQQTETRIGDDVWIGYGDLLLRGVTIRGGAIVRASALVTKDVPPHTLVTGCPARAIALRFGADEDRVRRDEMPDGPLVEPHVAHLVTASTHSQDRAIVAPVRKRMPAAILAPSS